MLKRTLFIALFVLSFSINSQEWNQNDEATKVIFSTKKFQVKVKGIFNDVNIQTNFNSSDLEKSYVNVKICLKSISTGKKGRDKKILSKNFFYEQKHKFIEVKSSKIEKRKNGEIILLADVTIKGITKELQIPLQVSEDDKNISIVSNFKINRDDFKVGEGSLGMSKSANIVVAFSGTK
ncbi:YceI family protein [Polaribacter vadi]|uniref:YceI family protein n=1 Tax=Polaribacter TaxID=52959 RepID=UPI001C094ECF|nr:MULTISPECIES: YceI family protein [Polaribacter]MBU3011411.1 YceI family protein [Polaribacter vadi]MDO6741223.1 YceI family protein [Polaribacter sp. 1_MG-2023]